MMVFPVRPTMRGIVLMLTAAGCTGAAIVNVNLTTSLIASCMLAIVIGSLFLAFFSVHRIDLKRSPNRDGACGSPLQLPFTITNRSWQWRQALLIRERIDFTEKYPFFYEAVESLRPHENRLIRRIMPAVKRGFYRLGRVDLIGGDPAGFFCYLRRFNLPGEVMIYPENLRLSQLPDFSRRHSIQSVTGRPLGISGAGQEFFGVREYSPHDEMRFIHWKASAKHRKLMVKEFESNIISHIYIILDAEKCFAGYDFFENNFECLVKAAAAIVNCLADMHCRLTFVTAHQKQIVRFTGEAVGVRKNIIDLMAIIEPTHMPLRELVDSEIDRFDCNSIFYCLSMSEPEHLAGKLLFLQQKGVDVRWILAPRQYFPRRDAWKTPKIKATEWHSAEKGGIQPVIARQDSDIIRMLSHE